jgi:AcrR family transcriptional regulator
MQTVEVKARRTRDLIVRAADDLFYRKGFEYTSFADIADAVRISRGNFYYHFKSKDEILAAVIESRAGDRREMLRQWELEEPTPGDRVRRYINLLIVDGPDIKEHGCPVGTLTTELSKLKHGSREDAAEVFTVFRVWLRDQFAALGRTEDADRLALHLLSAVQGIATIYNAYQDEDFLRRETAQLCEWVGTLDAVVPSA